LVDKKIHFFLNNNKNIKSAQIDKYSGVKYISIFANDSKANKFKIFAKDHSYQESLSSESGFK